jgi:hypothetical protein
MLIANNGLEINEEEIMAYNVIGTTDAPRPDLKSEPYVVSPDDIEKLFNIFKQFRVNFKPGKILEGLLEESSNTLGKTIKLIGDVSFIDFETGLARGNILSGPEIRSWVANWQILEGNITRLKEGYKASQNKSDALEQMSNAMATILNVQMQLATFCLPDKVIKDILIKEIALINSWENFSNIKKFEPSKTKIFCQNISQVKTFIEKKLTSFMNKCTDYFKKLT